MNKFTNRDKDVIYKRVTETILEQLRQGVAPWNMPWIAESGQHGNIVSGKAYQGLNQLLCWCYCQQNGWTSPHWATFNQIKKKGGKVKKGSKANYITFWKWYEPKAKKGQSTTEEEKKGYAFLKVYQVFNLEQTTGIEDPTKEKRDPIQAIDEADQFINRIDADITYGGDRAYYSPKKDIIKIPDMDRFIDSESFYSTILHELGHWTGHVSRLNRFEKSQGFGSVLYAEEELVAELTSAFLCAHVGISGNLQHPNYIGSWIKVLENDPKAVVKAATAARKASNLLISLSEKGSTQTTEEEETLAA